MADPFDKLRTSSTREQVATGAVQTLFQQEKYKPETLKAFIRALKEAQATNPPPDYVVVSGKPYSPAQLSQRLAAFLNSVPPAQRINIASLDQLDSFIDRVSGLTPTPPPSNIPINLKELVAAHQASLEAQKTNGVPAKQIDLSLKAQTEFITSLNQIRNASRERLFWAASNSQYITDLATAMGVRREHVEGLLKQRIDQIVDQAITTQAFRQAQLTTQDPNQLATYFTKQVQDLLKKEGDLAYTALATNRKDAKEAIQKIKEETTQEIGKARPAAETVSKNIAQGKMTSVIETANPRSILSEVRTHPERFPAPFVRAVRDGVFSTPESAARVFALSQELGISPDAAILSLGGIDATRLALSLLKGRPIFGLSTVPALSENDAFATRLTALGTDQARISNSIKTNTLSLPIFRSFQPIANRARSAVAASEFFRGLNPVSIISYRVGQINQIRGISSAVGGVFSRAMQIPLAPFRAVGGFVSQKWDDAKSWAGVQVRSGLSKAGAWLAKKGLGIAAKKLGETALAKGTALLLEQAIPIVGQVVAAAQIGGDILRFLWNQRENVFKAGLGLFVIGQLILRGLIGLVTSAGWGILGGGIGAALGLFVGGPVGALVGGAIGAITGAWIGSGGVAGLLSGIGGALGSGAAGLSSFLGALTAPSLMAGVGGTVAAVGLGGIGVGWVITTFFVNPTISAALFVPPTESFIGVNPGTPVHCTADKEALPFPNNSASPIARRAWEITSDLYQGFWCFWNRSPGGLPTDQTLYPPSYPNLFDMDLFRNNPNPGYPANINLFWCTWLPVKAYNETGSSLAANLSSQVMADDFDARGKFLKNHDITYTSVSSGDVIFYRVIDSPTSYRFNHVGVVYEVTKSYIRTVESNASWKTSTITVADDGHIENLPGITVEGFGKP